MGIGIQTQGLLRSENFGDIINPTAALSNLLTTLASGSIYLKEDLDFLENISLISQSQVTGNLAINSFDITLDSQILKLSDILQYNDALEVIRPVTTLKNRFDYFNIIMGEPSFQGGNGLTRRTYEWDSLYPASSTLPGEFDSSVFENASPVDTDIFWGRGSITYDTLSLSRNIKKVEGVQVFSGFFKTYQSGVHKFTVADSTNGGVVIELTDESGNTMLSSPIYHKPVFTSPNTTVRNTLPLEKYKFYNIKIYFLRSPSSVQSRLRHDAAINLDLPVIFSRINFYYDFLYDEDYLNRNRGYLGYFYDNKLPLMGTNFHKYSNNKELFSIGGAVSGAYNAVVTTGKLTINYKPPKFYTETVITKSNCALTQGRNYVTNIDDTSTIRAGNLVLDSAKTLPAFTYVQEVIDDKSVFLTNNSPVNSTTSKLFFIEHKGLKGYTQDYTISKISSLSVFSGITNYKGDAYKPRDVVMHKSLTVGGYSSISAISSNGSLVMNRPFLNTADTSEPLLFYYRGGVDNISLDGFCTGGNVLRLVTAKTSDTSNDGTNTLTLDADSIFDYEGNKLTVAELQSTNFSISAYQINYDAAIPSNTRINSSAGNVITLSKNLDQAIRSGTALNISLSTPSNPPGDVRYECFPPGETVAPFIGTTTGISTPYLSGVDITNKTVTFNKLLILDNDTENKAIEAPSNPQYNTLIPVTDVNNLTLYLLASTNNVNSTTTTTTTTTIAPWVSVSTPPISGNFLGMQLGFSLDLNLGGDFLIAGAPARTGTSTYLSAGYSAIYNRSGSSAWTLVSAITGGRNPRELRGYSVKLDNSGFTAIIGSPGYRTPTNATNAGHGAVQVLSSSNNGTTYTTLSTIEDTTASLPTTIDLSSLNRFGFSVDISGDGKKILVGAPGVDITSNDNKGRVRAYSYNGSTWLQLGGDIVGEKDEDQCGTCVAMNQAGDIITVSSSNKVNSDFYGRVRIFSLISSAWIQKGNSIDGPYPGYRFGQSIDINSAGDIVVVGAPNTFPSSQDPGIVRVYKFNEVTSNWDQYGQDIFGSGNSITEFGNSVSINSTGNIIAVGATVATEKGIVRLFEYNSLSKTWVQLKNSIEGSAIGSGAGSSVSINGEGYKFAVGSPYTAFGNISAYSNTA